MRPVVREKKKKVSATLKVSLWFNNRDTLGSYRGLNQSEIVKGRPPPLIGHGPECLKILVLLQSDRERGE